MPLVWKELRKLVADKLSREKPGQKIQATVLAHEGWLRLVGTGAEIHGRGPGDFFGSGGRAMQWIHVEYARRRKNLKADFVYERLELSHVAAQMHRKQVGVLKLDEPLAKLESRDPRKAEAVGLRFPAGLTREEVARALGVSVSNADKEWAYARTWLRLEMAEPESERQDSKFFGF